MAETIQIYLNREGVETLVSLIKAELAKKANTSSLKTVATSGKYTDLTGTPDLKAVATSGSYNDLTNKPTIPSKTSQLTNDSSYQTSAQVQTLINNAIGDITGIDIVVVSALPTTGKKGTIYLIKHSHSTGDVYDEYIWVTDGSTSSFEKIGNTDIDLAPYLKIEDLDTKVAALGFLKEADVKALFGEIGSSDVTAIWNSIS